MRVVQFEVLGHGRRVGVVDGNEVIDITASQPELSTVYSAFEAAQDEGIGFEEILEHAASDSTIRFDYTTLYEAPIGGSTPFLRAPLDHEDPHKVLISGTGLTHTGSMESRDQMHSGGDEEPSEEPTTDSAKMFQMGLDGGSPAAGTRGTSPEWFYKGNGTSLMGPGEGLEKPAFALDGGEEPELVGCYIIDRNHIPRRLGFTLGNEWSDHETERINYLYLAPSKLRYCSAGPELVTDFLFDELKLGCSVTRDGKSIYESGTLYSGEKYMSHSLANCEDHHFKYPQHRQPGDIHLHYFGTSQLSFATRDWKFQAGDEITITSEAFSRPLRNTVIDGPSDAGNVIRVVTA